MPQRGATPNSRSAQDRARWIGTRAGRQVASSVATTGASFLQSTNLEENDTADFNE